MNICMIGSSGHGGMLLPSLQKRADIKLTGFCKGYPEEPDAAFRQAASALSSDIKEYGSYMEMLKQENPELVIVDGMFCDHAEMAMESMRRGSHVITDKPVATSLENLDRLCEAKERSGKQLFALLTMRYEPCFYTARCLVQEGAVGQLRLFNGQKSYRLGKRPPFYKNREQFGGLIPWVSIHMVDLILWISGKSCLSLSAMEDNSFNRGNGDLEMVSLCSMQLEDHIIASVSADYYRPEAAPSHGDDRLRIVGTDGVLEVSHNRITLIDKEGLREIPARKAPDLFDDCLKRIGDEENLDGLDGIVCTRLCLLARQSADENSRRILL